MGFCSRRFRNSGEHLGALFSDGNRVLNVGTRLPIHCYDSPAVGQNLRKMCPLVDHWFHRENIASLYLGTKTRFAVVGNLRVFMHSPADPMTNVISNNRVTAVFSVLLHRPADVAEMIAGATLLNRQLKTLFSNPNKR